MPSASCIFIELSIYCQTIQPVENIGDVLHDENVNHIVLRTKLNIISLPERNKAILTWIIENIGDVLHHENVNKLALILLIFCWYW